MNSCSIIDAVVLNPFTGQDEKTRPAVAAFPMGRTRYLVRTGVVVSDLGKPRTLSRRKKRFMVNYYSMIKCTLLLIVTL